MNPTRIVLCLLAFLPFPTAGLAAPQFELPQGAFFEAEDYDRLVRGETGFAKVTVEVGVSGGKIILGMFADGLIRYDLAVLQAGSHALWARCAAPGDATAGFGFGGEDAGLATARVAKTVEGLGSLTAPNAYQWRRLGSVDLPAGKTQLLLGRGALRYDCFFLSRQPEFVVTDALLTELERAKETPKGRKLPELVHTRAITRHPQWLMQNALRPAYAHCEWDKANTPQSWAKMAREAGANCLVGVGEMPAGTLDGTMKAFPFESMDKKGFKLPPGYRKDDHSWVKEFADAGHAEGLKVVMYDGAYRTLDPLLLEHPEWRQLDAKGAPYRAGFGSWHSPYRAAYIARWVKAARECGIDGIMVDMLFTAPRGGDHSPFAVKAFNDRFGVEPPRVEDPRDLTWQRWIDFQAWTREEVMLDVTEALHAVSPEIACIWNQTTGWVFDGREYLTSRAGKCADGLLEEMGWEVSHGAFDSRPFAWPLQSAWQSLFLRCRTAYGQMWHLNGFYTRVNHEALSYSMFANGIAPAVVTGGNWDYLKRIWSHIQACEKHMAGATLAPYAALHFSEDTLQWHANARGDDARQAYLRNVFGFFQALLETHLPVAIVTDDELADAAALRRYATVVLPNTSCLSDQQAAALAAYVREGGGLIASFETGVFDEDGTRREKPALEELLGVKQGAVVGGRNWMLDTTKQTHRITRIPEVTDGGDPSQGSRDRKPQVTFFVAHASRDARIVKTTAQDGIESVRLGGPGSGYSALHTRVVGRGRVAYFPPDIGHGYFAYNHPIARRLIERTVRWSAGQSPFLETDAPMAVQTVCFRKGDDLVVHLVNDNSSFGRAAAPNPESFGAFRDEVLPVHGVKLAVSGNYRKAILLPDGKELAVRSNDGKVETTVPRVDIHAMVVFTR